MGKCGCFQCSERLRLCLCLTVSPQNGLIPDYVTMFWSHSSLVSHSTNALVPVSPLMNSSKYNLHPHPTHPAPCIKLQNIRTRCLFFFSPAWSHLEHLFWSHGAKVGCSFDALLRADLTVTFSLWTDAALMTRWHIGLLQYSQLYYLWKSFGMLLHMSEVH